jgi:hypothetical protein
MNPHVSRRILEFLQTKIRRQPAIAVAANDEFSVPVNLPCHAVLLSNFEVVSKVFNLDLGQVHCN